MKARAVVAIIFTLFTGIVSASAAPVPTLSGTALDASGGALPGVTVTVTRSEAQAEPQVQVTDGEGHFAFDELAPGTYTLLLELPGFEEKKFDALSVPGTDALKVVMAIAGLAETVTVRPTEPIVRAIAPRDPIGEMKVSEAILAAVPLANEKFEDALPLIPGIVRGPDGMLNMNGARADQSTVTLNGVSMSDPVTNHVAVRLPLEAIESLNVHAGVYSAAFGSATGGVTDIVTRSGQDKLAFQVQNLIPRFRFVDGGIDGFDSFTPRVRVSGPIQAGRLWFSQSASFRWVRTEVKELEPRDQSEQKVKSFDSVTQLDYAMTQGQHMTGTFVVFPSNIDNAGIDTLHPYDATPDMKQRGWAGSVAHRAVLADNMTLSTVFALKQFNMAVAPKHDTTSYLTVNGATGNYFNRFDRDSNRYDASSTLAISLPSAVGDHLVRAGGRFARTSYDGIDRSLPVQIVGASGQTLRDVNYQGSGIVGASSIEFGGFLEDEWALNQAVTLHGGVRYGYDQIAGQQTLAPRADASIRPFENGRTVIKAGIGRFYDALPLNAADFNTQQSRTITQHDANGQATASALLVNQTNADGLKAPSSTTWNVELDQMLTPVLMARVGYRHTYSSNQLIVDPMVNDGALMLSSSGTARSHEFEATLRRQFSNASHITASYVRSRTEGDLNDFVSLFGDLREPVIHPNEYGRQSFDTPNRFLVWGVMNLPHGIAVSPTIEYRNGFPYTAVDEQQDIVGARNAAGRYPHLLTVDMAVTKDVSFWKTHKARVGVQVFNLTNHLNPQDVQNNTSSSLFGDVANSVGRQVRAKFVVLF